MIEFQNISKVFKTKEGDVAAVQDLSFTIPDGEFFTLLGPSGCGKTTTLRMLAGLQTPDQGVIKIADDVVYSSSQRLDVPTHKRNISMVFQSYAIWPHMTVFKNVSYPLEIAKVPRKEIATRVERVLDLVGLEGMGSRQATRLSGGQQQRVALARALVNEPKVLLLDEPLSNLDARLRTHMRLELKALQSRIGVTTVYVTHDQQEALAMSDEIAVMDKGRIAQRGHPTAIYHRPRNRFTAEFIGTTNLLGGTSELPIQEGANEVETSLGPITVDSSEALPPQQREVVISIRPEAFTLRKPGERLTQVEPVNTLSGTIEVLQFLGESVDCDVRVGNSLIRVKDLAMEPLPVGTEVHLDAPQSRCSVLVDEVEGLPDDSVAIAESSDGLVDDDVEVGVES